MKKGISPICAQHPPGRPGKLDLSPFSLSTGVWTPPPAAITLNGMSDVTLILGQIEAGDADAAEKLLPLVYEELRKLAMAKMTNERADHTLQSTALVHEAYLRLVGSPGGEAWSGRGHERLRPNHRPLLGLRQSLAARGDFRRVSRKALAGGFVRENATWFHRRLAPCRSDATEVLATSAKNLIRRVMFCAPISH